MTLEAADVRSRLRDYLLTQLIHRPGYPLKDDEAMISSGLIDSFSLAQIAVYVEDAFGVFLPDTDLTVDNMDTLDQMVAEIMREL